MAGTRRNPRSNVVPKEQKYTRRDFERDFPDDDTCLEWLKVRLYPDGIHCPVCDRVTKHHRVASRKSYSCQNCGHHVHPTAGTIFHKSSTPLTEWFYAIFIMSNTRCGISAKQLQRELGVTYKTAWRMFKQIRLMLADEDTKIGGPGNTVEADETYVGGKTRRKPGQKGPTRRYANKTPVFAAVERGGKVVAKALPANRKDFVVDSLRVRILPRSLVYTDESTLYTGIDRHGYEHRTILHGAAVYVDGDVHTNTIENFFSLFKGGLRGVYKHVGAKYLQSYVDEYAFRYNHRKDNEPMFKIVLSQVRRLDAASPS
jgi:transposase